LSSQNEVSQDPDRLPAGLVKCDQKRRIDDTIFPTSFSEIRYYLDCPMNYRFRLGFGLSPMIPEMFGMGKTVHTAIDKLHETFASRPPTEEEAESVVRQIFHLKHVPQSGDPINKPGPYERAQDRCMKITKDYVNSYQEDFNRSREIEARFEINAEKCVISGSIDLLLREDDQGKILDAEVIDYKSIDGGEDPEHNPDLDWTGLSLQVQLYAKAAQNVLGENTKTGSVHLLKNNKRINVPVDDNAITSAVNNVEWAVQGILAGDYPMRPHQEKCTKCDFGKLCPCIPKEFTFSKEIPYKIHLPDGEKYISSFGHYNPNYT
jgi:DNA helicase-2/ATP-dependent DNA helicase PcrA